MSLNFRGRVFERSDELLELRVGMESLQIVVSHETVGIFISAIDGLAKILERVARAVRGRCYAGEGIPYREGVALRTGVAPLCDHVAEQSAGFGIAMTVGERCSQSLERIQRFCMLRAQSAKPDFERLPGDPFRFRVMSFPNQNLGQS